jgi:outer membrane protein insertion porin family
LITKENLLEMKSRLENLRYFESVESPKILKYKNETVLLIKVKEGSTNTFDGILGYVPPAANETSGYITGMANISLTNLFGTGRRLDARYEKQVRTTQELELSYLEPWVFGFPVNVNLGFLQRVEDTIYIKRTFNTKTDVSITPRFTVSALFFGEQVIPTASPQTAIVFNSRLLSTGIELKYDSRDYVYNPFKGILLRSSYAIGQKKIYNTGDYPNLNLPADFTVQKASFELEFYSSFFRRQSALLSVHGFEIRSPRFETSDFFRFGGTRSVRGYREGQFLGSRVVWNNNELRYSLTRRSFAVALFDMGYYWRPADEEAAIPKQEGFIFGYGLGIRVETSLGIFGVSYALGRGDSILEGKVHFGIVNDF